MHPHLIEPAVRKARHGRDLRATQDDAGVPQDIKPGFTSAGAGNQDDTAQVLQPGPPMAGDAHASQARAAACAPDPHNRARPTPACQQPSMIPVYLVAA
jgi:hypothetical protein